MAGINCSDIGQSPEDFLRKILRKDGTGKYAIAVNDVSGLGFTNAATCADGISWQDIIALVFDKDKNAINIVDET